MTALRELIEALPSQEELLRLFSYDPDTGVLFWKERTPNMFVSGRRRSKEWQCSAWNAAYAGKPALHSLSDEGYRKGRLWKKSVKAHRVVWKMVHGTEPLFIDHVNGDPSDNRIENLRNVSFADNVRNAKLRSDNKSGVPGVAYRQRDQKWYARAKVDGREKHIGSFFTKEEAIAARRQWQEANGFHPNHGRVA